MPTYINKPAEGVPFFTPAQDLISGSAQNPQPNNTKIPKLFTPLTIRDVTFQNRIFLSPLCQYSALNGHLGPWHLAHLGGIISRGPGLAIMEATAVSPEGRITPQDAGIWEDAQLEGPYGLRSIVDFAHSQGQKIGIQLAHAGRKASNVAPWLHAGIVAQKDEGGWPEEVVGASAVGYNEQMAKPKAMSLEDIECFKKSWVDGVKRAVKAGFDVLEIHNAHGYLLQSFLSPVSNKRTDRYGGSFENRTRLTLEVVELARKEMPKGMPLFLRISATEWLEDSGSESWTNADTIRLAPLLAAAGVDLLDVSSGANSPNQKIKGGPGYQAPFSKEIKKVVGEKMFVSTVGSISSGTQAESLLTGKGEGSRGEQELDVAMVGRGFQKEPGLVWRFAEELGCEIHVANQIQWGFGGRGAKALGSQK